MIQYTFNQPTVKQCRFSPVVLPTYEGITPNLTVLPEATLTTYNRYLDKWRNALRGDKK